MLLTQWLAVRTKVEELPESRVRLEVEVPEEDVEHALEHAASDLAAVASHPRLPQGQGACAGRRRQGRPRGSLGGGGAEPPRRLVLERSGHVGGPAGREPRGRGRRRAARGGRGLPLHRHGRRSCPSPSWPTGRSSRSAFPRPRFPPSSSKRSWRACARRSPSSRPSTAGRRSRVTWSSSTWRATQIGATQRDYVVEVGSGRLVDEIEAALVGMAAGEKKAGRVRACRRQHGDRGGDRQARSREGAAAARRRPRQGGQRVRDARGAALRHRGASCASSSKASWSCKLPAGRASTPSSARPPSTSIEPMVERRTAELATGLRPLARATRPRPRDLSGDDRPDAGAARRATARAKPSRRSSASSRSRRSPTGWASRSPTRRSRRSSAARPRRPARTRTRCSSPPARAPVSSSCGATCACARRSTRSSPASSESRSSSPAPARSCGRPRRRKHLPR